MKAPQPTKTAKDKTKASNNLFSKPNLQLTNKYKRSLPTSTGQRRLHDMDGILKFAH
jgi:hypothetical protein